MNSISRIVTVLLTCGIFLSACGLGDNTENNQTAKSEQAVSNNSQLLNNAQSSIKATIGQEFMTIKTEDGTAYTWDKGLERNDLQAKIDTMLTSLRVKRVGIKERPTPFVAMLFQKTSVIIPYGASHPERNILIENNEGTFIGECPAEDLNAVLKWLRDHKVKIVQSSQS